MSKEATESIDGMILTISLCFIMILMTMTYLEIRSVRAGQEKSIAEMAEFRSRVDALHLINTAVEVSTKATKRVKK